VNDAERLKRVVLDMDSTQIPVYGQQEESAYNGHFESTCYHPLLLCNRDGDCLGAKLRPSNLHCADPWEELLLPEIQQQKLGKGVVFRAGPRGRPAFAKPEIYEAMEERGVQYAIRIPGKHSLSNEVRLWLSVIAYNLGNLWRGVPTGPGGLAGDSDGSKLG